MHRCTPTRDAWLNWSTTKIHPEVLARRSNQERLQNKIVFTTKCFPEALARGPPRKQTHQNKLVITRECISEASARGVSPSWSPKEMLQNKIVLFRVLARVPPGKAPEQDCYYQEMPSRSFGQGVPLGKAPEQDSDYQDKL